MQLLKVLSIVCLIPFVLVAMAFRIAIFVIVVLFQTKDTGSFTINDLTEHTWEGRFGFFAVPRERIAKKLTELRQSSCHEGKYLLHK